MKKQNSYFEGILGSNKTEFSKNVIDEIITNISSSGTASYKIEDNTLKLFSSRGHEFINDEDIKIAVEMEMKILPCSIGSKLPA